MEQLHEEECGALTGVSPWLAERTRDVARGFLMVLVPDGGPQAEAVLLVVSELITNAVQHASGVTGFGLTADRTTVTVMVADSSRRPPCTPPLDQTRLAGFGWRLVQDLALDVKVRIGSSGKTVSAVLPLPH